ncbi:HTH domain-containing protein [Streptomyces sp. NPDC047315]|uniref:HTH domain-containing protein n=1 Tax=Streptomyces sp. NPDC047315 TaxID=3155142 RepID=UPI0033CBB3F9
MATTNRSRNAATEVRDRRDRVAQLLADGVAQATIARQLNVSKYTVHRDVRALKSNAEQRPDQAQPAAPQPARNALARRAEEACNAMRDLDTAVAQLDAARPSHVAIPTATAHSWAQQLRDHAATLLRLADDFAEYYPRR